MQCSCLTYEDVNQIGIHNLYFSQCTKYRIVGISKKLNKAKNVLKTTLSKKLKHVRRMLRKN